jgi:hypothetical protein
MTTAEKKAWLQGFAAVLVSTWMLTHDAQLVEQALRDHQVTRTELRAAVIRGDYDTISNALKHRRKRWPC